jgi:hypothetical protein
VALDIQPVAQPQRAEFLLGELAGEVAAHLVTEFRHALIDQRLVQLVVTVHAARL